MRLEQLRYLSDLQYTNSISKTANRFFTSPQSVSSSMQQLEKEMGALLLDRSSLGVSLTGDALKLLKITDPFLTGVDRLHDEFELQKFGDIQQAPHHVRICCSSVLAELALPKALSVWNRGKPHTKTSVHEMQHDEIFPAIVNHECDLAFLSINAEYFLKQVESVDSHSIHYHIMLTDRLVACVSAQSALAKKEVIEQTDIMGHPFTYLNIVPLARKGANYSNLALYTSPNIEFHNRALRELDVIALMPRYVFSTFFNDKRHICKSIEGARQTIYHVAIYPDDKPNPIMRDLVNTLSSFL